MARSDTQPSKLTRLGIAAFVAALHLAAVVALLHAFAPQIVASLPGAALSTYDVPIASPPPRPQETPRPAPRQQTKPEGAAAPAGKRASPREVTALKPALVLTPERAPITAAKGTADNAGAAASGAGSGAGGTGRGTGAGSAGNGTGGGGGQKAVKIAGDIVSARDYPKATRALRLGSAVTIALTVATDGRVSACRIVRPSRDPEADRITCSLASERFRFRPALDAQGTPITSTYGWQQRWFAPPTE